jgi:phage shock protein C
MEGKRFARSKNARIFGVCAGMAEYFGITVGAMRFMWVVFALLTWLGLAFAAYVALAFIMPPPEGAPQGERFWHHVEGRSFMMIFAIVLMCIGGYIILNNLLGWILWKFLFPIGLIIVGALFFAFAFGKNQKKP